MTCSDSRNRRFKLLCEPSRLEIEIGLRSRLDQIEIGLRSGLDQIEIQIRD